MIGSATSRPRNRSIETKQCGNKIQEYYNSSSENNLRLTQSILKERIFSRSRIIRARQRIADFKLFLGNQQRNLSSQCEKRKKQGRKINFQKKRSICSSIRIQDKRRLVKVQQNRMLERSRIIESKRKQINQKSLIIGQLSRKCRLLNKIGKRLRSDMQVLQPPYSSARLLNISN